MRLYNSRRRVDRWNNPADEQVGRTPRAAALAELTSGPVQNILVHMPGGGVVMVVARYSYSPLTNRVARLREWITHPNNPLIKFDMTDIRTRIPLETRLACPLDWSGCIRGRDYCYPDAYAGLLTVNIDYALIRRAVELIRSVHGPVPVAWNLRPPWSEPNDIAPFLAADSPVRPRDPTRAAVPEPMFNAPLMP